VGVFAPFFEELVFRRIILAWFISRKKFTLGLAISSILFGLYHMAFGWGILKAVDMTLVGATFGLSYRRYQFRGSLLTHYANNIMSLANMLVF
jgi:membrane protease YdiL (CAAX protease family)